MSVETMSKIIDFPTNAVREWASIEKTLRGILDNIHASDEFKDTIVSRMKDAYQEHQFSYPLSFAVPEGNENEILESLNGYRNALQEHTSNLLISRLKLEIELAIAQGII